MKNPYTRDPRESKFFKKIIYCCENCGGQATVKLRDGTITNIRI